MSRAVLLAAAALALAGCSAEKKPCALFDCGGACVDVRVDAANCGACGRPCPEGQLCSGGACALACEAPLVACASGGALACTAVQTDAASCGACGVACPAGQVCAEGACAPVCAAPLATCGSGDGAWCADLARDRLNCGACAHACAPGWPCADGTCVESCGAASLCDGACVDLWTDARHCGACGLPCGPGDRCAGAVCQDACALDGLTRCGAACADLRSDAGSCGACGRACAAGARCVRGECVAAACASGLHLPGGPDVLETVASRALLAADVDGDGVPDLLLRDFDASRIVLHRGRASGGFGPMEDAIAVAGRPAYAADVDRDGDRDLLVIGESAVTVYLNDGAGHFVAGASYPDRANAALAADLDSDGLVDVATASSAGYVYVRLAATGGSAGYLVAYSTLLALHATDLDRDGDLDLVAAPYSGYPVAVLRNQGYGTFAGPVTTDPGATLDFFEVADLDGDGDDDGVYVGRANVSPPGYVLGVLRNDDGTLVPAGVQRFDTAGYIYDLVVADLDGDARPDAATGEIDTYRIFRNQGDGTFAPPVLAVSGGAQSVAALDADRDGRVDLVSASAIMGGVEIRRQLADGAWDGPEVLPIAAEDALLADLDGDGRDDLVTLVPADVYGGEPMARLELRLARATGFGPATGLSGFGWTGVLAGDLDRDGAVDLVVTRADRPAGVLRNRGGGALEDEVPVMGVEGVFALADVTGDGVLDLVGISSTYVSALLVAVGYGNGGFAPPAETSIPDAFAIGRAIADVDGDGRADAALLVDDYYTGQLVRVHPGRPDGTFGAPWERAIVASASHASALALAAGDLDGDGRADLAALFYWREPDRYVYHGTVAVLRGGAAGPAAPEIYPMDDVGSRIAIGDLSGDGHRDVLVAKSGVLGVLAGRDGGLAPEVFWAAPAPGLPVVGDIDGDLRGDVVIPVGNRVVLYRGACPAP